MRCGTILLLQMEQDKQVTKILSIVVQSTTPKQVPQTLILHKTVVMTKD